MALGRGGWPPLLHPRHATSFNACTRLANCCRVLGDHAQAAQLFAHTASCMEAAYPPNFPETADYLEAHAQALGDLLENAAAPSRGGRAGPGARSALTAGWAGARSSALERCAAIRAVCFGPDAPGAVEARKEAARALRGER